MGKFKRIPMKDIKTMQKILDDLPDKNLGKTREEAAELLNAHILKALEKGYTVKECRSSMESRCRLIIQKTVSSRRISRRASFMMSP